MTEAELYTVIRDAARKLGVLAYHTRDSRGSDPGFPDLVLAGPGGLIIRELKSETGRITAAQAEWLQLLRREGIDAKIWQPADWPRPIMCELGRVAGRLAGMELVP